MQNQFNKRYHVKRMDISINMEKTGKNIKNIIKNSGYSMHDIMLITGITTEQSIYKWYSGKSIPSPEVQIILCELFHIRQTELLVIDGEFDLYGRENSPGDSPGDKKILWRNNDRHDDMKENRMFKMNASERKIYKQDNMIKRFTAHMNQLAAKPA